MPRRTRIDDARDVSEAETPETSLLNRDDEGKGPRVQHTKLDAWAQRDAARRVEALERRVERLESVTDLIE